MRPRNLRRSRMARPTAPFLFPENLSMWGYDDAVTFAAFLASCSLQNFSSKQIPRPVWSALDI
eukprot:6523607-Pyramimonas_sp.AAC.1